MELAFKKICLLDTNFVSEILKGKSASRSSEQKELSEKISLKIYKNKCTPAISMQTIFELSKNKEIFELFENVFSLHNFYILKNWRELAFETSEERGDFIECLCSKDNNKLKEMLESGMIDEGLRIARESEDDVKKDMEDKMDVYKKCKFTDEQILEKTVEKYIEEHGLKKEDVPTMPIYLFLHHEIFILKNSSKDKVLNDIRDAQILSCALKIVDMVCTDNAQKEFIKQMKEKDLVRENLEVYAIKDIRNED